eukprot:1177053-Prorocentrum_minimum.AAC.3
MEYTIEMQASVRAHHHRISADPGLWPRGLSPTFHLLKSIDVLARMRNLNCEQVFMRVRVCDNGRFGRLHTFKLMLDDGARVNLSPNNSFDSPIQEV